MKYLKGFLMVAILLILLAVFVGMPYAKKQTKKHSPEQTSVYTEKGMDLSVTYSSPSKKGRSIFGDLVPYGKVWRTGANEPTTFTTKSDIVINGQKLPMGTYSLWTRPNPKSWSVIWNREVPDWGVTILSGGKETTRNPEADAITIEVPVQSVAQEMEKLTIDFEENNGTQLCLAWDTTKVCVPLSK